MTGASDRLEKVPRGEVAAAYLPVARAFLFTTAVYYGVIAVSHLFYEAGTNLFILVGLAVFTAVVASIQWLFLRRGVPPMLWLEAGILLVNALFMANVVAYLTLHFEPLKLFYFVLMALVFATAAPTRRVAYVSVAAAGAGMLILARRAPGDLINGYAFVGLAGGFAAVGLSTLMRGAVLRELSARLASDALNRTLTAKLEENERLRADAQQSAAAAQAANRAKSEFLATISHEIRTPLNGVMGMAAVMEQRRLSKAQRGRLAVIQSSARTLLDVVNAVLDISRIEAGKLDITPAPFSLDRFAASIERLYGPLAVEKGLVLSVEVDSAARGWRHGDEIRLLQVLSNLVSNAVKFTEAGSIVVLIRGDAQRLHVSVSDTGCGVPADRREHIFEKFVQADGSSTRRAGGAGLGLAICREVLSLMGGAIAIETTPGPGARFVFDVPFPQIAPADQEPTSFTDADVQDELRLLVVDDNATNRAVLQALLQPLGAVIETAAQGREAVSAWEIGRWDAILMDIHMPEMDGLDASRTIRAREAATGRPRTPIIAVTASVLAHETQEYFKAGMDDVVAKPIELQRLIMVLEQRLAPPPAGAVAAGPDALSLAPGF